MNPWLSLFIGILIGGVLSWYFAQTVYNKGEEAFMTAKGYFKRGEDWVKSRL